MKIPIVLGPTSTGKTSLSINLSKRLNGEIISADSRQIYKYMDVGTGKIPIRKEIDFKRRHKHWILNDSVVWGYDLVTPDEYFSAYDFADFALNKAQDLIGKRRIPILAGGTGLYIDFFTGEISDLSGPPDMELRYELESKSLSELQNQITSLNIDLNRSDFNNKYRLVRILEKRQNKNPPSPLPYLEDAVFVYAGLTASRDVLYKRVDEWADSIWKEDLIVKEVENLISMGYEDSPKLSGLIYSNAMAFLKGKKNRKKVIQRTKFELHAYVRRQQTYFKRNKKIKWFDITKDNYPENLYNYFEEEGL